MSSPELQRPHDLVLEAISQRQVLSPHDADEVAQRQREGMDLIGGGERGQRQGQAACIAMDRSC